MKKLIVLMIATLFLASCITSHSSKGHHNGERPGYGYGDEKHDHYGPPGQDSDNDGERPGYGYGDENHDHYGPPGQDKDRDGNEGEGHGHGEGHGKGHGEGHGKK